MKRCSLKCDEVLNNPFTFPGGEGGPQTRCDEILATQGEATDAQCSHKRNFERCMEKYLRLFFAKSFIYLCFLLN